jgi:hypothetical protein
MSQFRFVLLISAGVIAASACAEAAPLISFSLNLPAPRVAVNQAIAPYAIAGRLSQQGFRVQDMHRRGPAYAVTAIGRHGNRVLLMVDGYSGVIIGMSVLQAVVPVIPETAPNAVFVDDTRPFGAVVPEVIYDHWDPEQWAQPGPAAIAIKPTYAPYQYAVPYKFVHSSPSTHKSYALAPPKYRGMQLRNSSGQQIRAAQTRADAADSEAAYQAERADQATYDKEQALDQRDESDKRADDLDKENGELANFGVEQEQRADAAEERAAAAEKQLQEQGQADDPCGSGCMAQPDLDQPEQGETPAEDEKPVEAEPTSPEGNPTEQPQAPQQEEPQAPQQDEPAPQQREEPAPQQQEEPAPQQQEEPAPQQQEEPAPQQEEPQQQQEEQQPQQQEEQQPQQQEEQQPQQQEEQQEPQQEEQQQEEPQQQEEEPQQEEPQMDDSSGDDNSGGDDSPGGNA